MGIEVKPRVTAHQALVEAYRPADPTEANARERILHLLTNTSAPFHRGQFDPGHVTASGLVVSPDGESILVMHHARLNRWLQPGGHLEPSDEGAWAAARREVHEETDVQLETGPIHLVGLDVHVIPAGRGEPAHEHHDLCFLVRARSVDISPSSESHAVEWRVWSNVTDANGDTALARYASNAHAIMSSSFHTA